MLILCLCVCLTYLNKHQQLIPRLALKKLDLFLQAWRNT